LPAAFRSRSTSLSWPPNGFNHAGGEAAIFATNSVDAKVRAGGDITIFGKPKQINKKIIAGGTIEQAK
jgi:hypothetical protein